MTANEIIAALLTTALPGTLAWAAINGIPALASQPAKVKAAAAFALSAALCVAAYGAGVAMLYTPQPADWRAWVEALTPVVAWSYAMSQAAYWATRKA
jgi:hypothetical protein